MKSSLPLLPILFALCTAICWGLYGPMIGNARSAEKLWSPFKPYVGIGLAYLLIAVIGGLIAMKIKGDSFSFTGKESAAINWGFIAGVLGALGALCLTSAMLSFGGPPKPQLIMPIVFGGAVTVTAIVSTIQHRASASPSPWLWVGIVGVVISIATVAYNTPHGAHGPKKTSNETEVKSTTSNDSP